MQIYPYSGFFSARINLSPFTKDFCGEGGKNANISCDYNPTNVLPAFSEAMRCTITRNMMGGNDNSQWNPSFQPSQGYPLTSNTFTCHIHSDQYKKWLCVLSDHWVQASSWGNIQQQSQNGIWWEHVSWRELESKGRRGDRTPPEEQKVAIARILCSTHRAGVTNSRAPGAR